MDALLGCLARNEVPPLWLKTCGQIGPTGTYNRKSLSAWFTDLLSRTKQLRQWLEAGLERPASVWISGLFNPMGYVTACLQVTARAKGLPLDSMCVHTEMTSKDNNAVQQQPHEGTYVHGLFMEGARWDKEAGAIAESLPKELHPPMPVMHIKGVTKEEEVTEGVYQCPVYTTTIRGPTFTFVAPLRSDQPARKWILAAVCMVMQPDQ
jgi:dynein heavy chain